MGGDTGSARESIPHLRDALLGDVQPAMEWLRSGQNAAGTACALRSVCALAHTPGVEPVTLDEVVRAGREAPEHRAGAAYACVYRELEGFLAFDPGLVRQWLHVHRQLVSADGDALALRLGQNWVGLLEGSAKRVSADAAELERDAARLDDAETVLTAAVQRGLAQLSLGDVPDALRIARRTARMARTESLLFHEYTANLALARIRRHAHQPHFSTRILSALARVLPPAWQPWTACEAFLAGGTSVGRLAETFSQCLNSARVGDRDDFDRRRSEIAYASTGWLDIETEVGVWLSALDPQAEVSDLVFPWVCGTVETLPGAVRSGPTESGTVAFAVRSTHGAARRVLAPGAGLVEAEAIETSPGSEAPTRLLSTVAVLLLAGDTPIHDSELFRQVYGFDFVVGKHDGVLRTLLHRVRATLGPYGHLERSDGSVTFRPRAALISPDPRCDVSVEERVLLKVAQSHAGLTSSAIARALQVPTRRVHAVLRTLTAEGACVSERDGRRVYFRVEDTTFNEPSLHRLGKLTDR